jgi:hypothetical protein
VCFHLTGARETEIARLSRIGFAGCLAPWNKKKTAVMAINEGNHEKDRLIFVGDFHIVC